MLFPLDFYFPAVARGNLIFSITLYAV